MAMFGIASLYDPAMTYAAWANPMTSGSQLATPAIEGVRSA
jgi:hypothetical protein